MVEKDELSEKVRILACSVWDKRRKPAMTGMNFIFFFLLNFITFQKMFVFMEVIDIKKSSLLV
jgi:hypothetical protein